MNDKSKLYSNIDKNLILEIEKFLYIAKNSPSQQIKIEVGEICQKLVDDARENGFNISGYRHDIDVSGIRHAFKQHGTGNERIADQIPITDNDIKAIPYIVNNYDQVTFGTQDRKGIYIIKYQKTIMDYKIYYIEEIRTGKKSLTLKTIYKKNR